MNPHKAALKIVGRASLAAIISFVILPGIVILLRPDLGTSFGFMFYVLAFGYPLTFFILWLLDRKK